MVISMTTRDWLTNYSNLDGLRWSLKGIASRISYQSGIENATEVIEKNYPLFEEDFFHFFPEIQQFCTEYIEKGMLDL